MRDPEITVIVPVYNVEKYLERCVQSIREQTFTDLEILLVDDGSPDRCGEMCDAYAREDERIRVIHKSNGGLSDARNAGIDAARGQYLGFVDSDDYIELDMYETLYTMITRENADVAVCGLHETSGEGEKAEIRVAGLSPETLYNVINTEEAVRLALEGGTVRVNCVNKLFQKKLFAKTRFPIGKLIEDAHIMIRLLSQADRVVITSAAKYHYIHREGSITTEAYRPQILNAIEAWENNYAFVKERYPKLIPQAECRYLWANFYVLDRMMLTPEKTDPQKEREIITLLRKNIWRILKNPGFQLSRKSASVCLLVSKRLYRLCALAYWRRHPIIS